MAKEVVKVGITGGEELAQMLVAMQTDFGEKTTKQVLVSAVRDSFAPALSKAKQLAVNGREYATGELSASLSIEARRPNRRDKQSVYVSPTDAVIAKITTAPKNKLIKIRRGIMKRQAKKEGKVFDEKKFKNTIHKFDARAVAQEFGTARHQARPFLRPAVESTAQEVIDRLADKIRVAISQYRAKNIK